LVEETAKLTDAIAVEAKARELADDEIVSAVNHYSAALQDGIKIVGS